MAHAPRRTHLLLGAHATSKDEQSYHPGVVQRIGGSHEVVHPLRSCDVDLEAAGAGAAVGRKGGVLIVGRHLKAMTQVHLCLGLPTTAQQQ